MIYDTILGTIGRTPIVRINRLAPAGTTMYVKCEFFNPASSVKDRLAIAIIEDAERRGELKPGQTFLPMHWGSASLSGEGMHEVVEIGALTARSPGGMEWEAEEHQSSDAGQQPVRRRGRGHARAERLPPGEEC